MSKLFIGSRIVMPEPLGADNWTHGGFMARVTDIIDKTGYAVVEDQDSDFFTIEIDRAERGMIDESDL